LSFRLPFACLLLALCAACSEPRLGVKIPFAARWAGQAIDCEAGGLALSDLRFFVYDIDLIDSRGKSQPVLLDEQFQWQQPGLALIDLENAKGRCKNGSAEVYSYLVGSVPPGDYRGLRFTVGVPFEQNHANPLTAEAPLDIAAMHWHWRSGYKFLRAGVNNGSDGFWIHVGSAGCEGTVRNITGCSFPNRIAVNLPEFQPRQHAVNVDLAALFGTADFEDEVLEDCSSGPSEISCIAPFRALGIDFESGKTVADQQMFSISQ
jgi:uncharacterized repeat protein (TIGR04052 family)